MRREDAEGSVCQHLAGNSREVEVSQLQAVFILDRDGNICECMREVQQVSGYLASEVCKQHISTLFPRLRHVDLLCDDQINSKLGYLFRIGFPFKLDHRNGADRECLISMVNLRNDAQPPRILMTVSLINCPVGRN